MRCVPRFTIHRVDEPRPLAEVLDGLDEAVDGNDHFEFFVFPYADRALTLTSERTDREPEPAAGVARAGSRTASRTARSAWRTSLSRLAPRLAPIRRNRAHHAADEPQRAHLDLSHRDLRARAQRALHRDGVRDPARARARGASSGCSSMVERRRLPVNFPIEVRFAAGDDAFLSTAHGRETGYIAVHVSHGCEFETYFRAVERIMDDYGGRPHWGKRHYQTAATLRPRYPDWDRFQAVRARLDPDGDVRQRLPGARARSGDRPPRAPVQGDDRP